ncbi:M56 family metallopeptidase [Brevundimonas goettingensis]|uniref:TonB family protein n=1 Tax=Brevundimonas goettingensis TaxID=2774190 RepID=A0A975C2I5_9CAUL|nr:M56 family metallopeptidase [Brevundimonas goettingensis]QTC92668.1 TonB family protein [Brevundimonas goettingensis]
MANTELLALSLGLSLGLAAATRALMGLFERSPSDPALRERGWALALYLPALPILLVGIAVLLPPLAVPLPPAPQIPSGQAALVVDVIVHRGVLWLQPQTLALAALGLAGLLCAVRAGQLALRTLGLRRFLRSTHPAPAGVLAGVAEIARRAAVPTPVVRIADDGAEAMIAGLFRPALILPAALVSGPALEAVCAHEMAHLRRGDHRALWAEEILLVLMAFNPFLGPIRARRAAAREEACDAEALSQASEAARRAYARSLLDALRVSPNGDAAPALTFTSSRRILVMRRLKAILSPVPVSGARHRRTLFGAGLTLAAVAGAGSFALAGQRAPEPQARPAAAPAARPLPVARPVAQPATFVSALPAPAPAPASALAPRAAFVTALTPAETPTNTTEAAPLTNPSWAQSPRPTWPQAAGADVTSGSAVVSCTAQADGHLTDCSVLSEEPVGAGFGPVAVEAAEQARLSPSMIDAGWAGKTIRFSVRFRLG